MEWFRLSNTCLPGLDDPEEPLITLTISDYNANGLGGPWNKPGKHSRFHNLVLSLNAGQKFYREEGMLGSYGIGKMVFARCSRIRTATYYSTFIEDGRHRARLMTSAFLPRHDFGSESFSGHAFLGLKGEGQYPSAPLEDAKAHEEAELLGF